MQILQSLLPSYVNAEIPVSAEETKPVKLISARYTTNTNRVFLCFSQSLSLATLLLIKPFVTPYNVIKLQIRAHPSTFNGFRTLCHSYRRAVYAVLSLSCLSFLTVCRLLGLEIMKSIGFQLLCRVLLVIDVFSGEFTTTIQQQQRTPFQI